MKQSVGIEEMSQNEADNYFNAHEFAWGSYFRAASDQNSRGGDNKLVAGEASQIPSLGFPHSSHVRFMD